jgi:hypothetical protein
MANNNNSKKQYIDIPLNVEETPLHLYEKFSSYKFPSDPVEVGFDFISRLDLNYFEPASAQRFSEREWPASFEIEGKFFAMQPSTRTATSVPRCRPSTTSSVCGTSLRN